MLVPVAARADLTIAVDNDNTRGRIDVYEVYDVNCDRSLGLLSIGGRTSNTITICGGLDEPGEVRIRYNGHADWSDYPALHGWSVVTLPSRPKDLPKPDGNSDDN